MAKTDLNKILQDINNHEYEDLEKFLKKTDWFSVPKGSILPRAKVRAFVTSIADDEVRLAVMRFLQKYEDHYFKEEDNVFEPVLGTDPIAAFHRELSVQIEQLTSTGEFSGNRFSKLEKQVAKLKEENEQYKKANQFLQEKIDRFEHPEKYNKYFPSELVQFVVKQPLNLLDVAEKYDIKVNLYGGGFTGQSQALRLAIARALVKINADDKKALRAAGFITRDARVVERKKPGRPKARRRFQFSKR